MDHLVQLLCQHLPIPPKDTPRHRGRRTKGQPNRHVLNLGVKFKTIQGQGEPRLQAYLVYDHPTKGRRTRQTPPNRAIALLRFTRELNQQANAATAEATQEAA